MKLKYSDIEFSLDLGSEPGLSDTGDLESDLSDLLTEVGNAAKQKKTALIIFVDEAQYLEESQFAALIVALHQCTQKQLPIAMVGAGLPQLIAKAGRAKSYAERLFEYPEIGALPDEAAKKALVNPALALDVKYEEKALIEILKQTQGYPYFLQEWGKHCWQLANESPITVKNAKEATELAKLELDASFFRVRFDRLTKSERDYLRAMAEINTASPRSGEIAALLKKTVQAVAPIRGNLISKGMIYSSGHGDNSFTVPLFGDYMKRAMSL